LEARVTFKDLFSAKAGEYARFRPRYPAALYEWVAAQPRARRLAVDVGTGNGQAAVELARHFERVIGVDPSAEQLANATPAANVSYAVGPAEATGVDPGSADLLTAAQAFHWFKQEAFFAEVRRVVRPGGCLVVWSYGLSKLTPEVDAAVHELYEDRLGRFWEPERRLVEQGYRLEKFPFEEISAPSFEIRTDWSFEQLVGYLSTWSPLKRYRQEHGADALEETLPRLQQAWGNAETRAVTWPLSVRAFRL
jgi:SAM-dependent methyltransferase